MSTTTCPDCGSTNVGLTSNGVRALCYCRDCGRVWNPAQLPQEEPEEKAS